MEGVKPHPWLSTAKIKIAFHKQKTAVGGFGSAVFRVGRCSKAKRFWKSLVLLGDKTGAVFRVGDCSSNNKTYK